ncbi:MAG: hypothetical protein ACK4N5_27350, partial [Myxococcales bacterium]
MSSGTPAAPFAGWVVNARRLAAACVTWKVALLAAVSEPEVARMVDGVTKLGWANELGKMREGERDER